MTQLPVAPFRLHSDDPSLAVTWLGGPRFALSGQVELDPSADLQLGTRDTDIDVTLARNSTPTHAVAALRRALPRHISMQHVSSTDGVELVFQEALVPAACPPRFRVWLTDRSMRVRQLDENKLEFVGALGEPCIATLFCDRRHVSLELEAGSSAQAVAAYVGANVPHGYRALVDGPTVSVWKDADFFAAVA